MRLDMAIWDAMGQSLGYSVTDLLGGFTDRMRVSHMLGFDEPAAMVAEAERMRDTYGITTFKVKVGRHPFTIDTAVVRALRERFGDEIELYVDGNRGWSASEFPAAARSGFALAPPRLFEIELVPDPHRARRKEPRDATLMMLSAIVATTRDVWVNMAGAYAAGGVHGFGSRCERSRLVAYKKPTQ